MKLVDVLVVRHQGQALEQLGYFAPYLFEGGCIVGVFIVKPVDFGMPVVVVVRSRPDKGVELVHNLAVLDNDNAHTANGTVPVICRFEVDGYKILHY